MSNHGPLTKLTLAGVLIVLALFSSHWIIAQETLPSPDVTTQTAVEPQQAAAAELAAKGWEDALAGNFDLGLTELGQSAKAMPDNTSVAEAVKLLGGFKTVTDRSDSQRLNEYKLAVEQVQRSLFAQKWRSHLASTGMDKTLRANILGGNGEATTAPASEPASGPASGPAATTSAPAQKSVLGAYNRTSTSDSLANTIDPETAQKLQTNTVKALAESRSALQEAVDLQSGDQDEYAKTFRDAALRLDAQLKKYSQTWESARLNDAKGIKAAVKEIRKCEDDLADRLADVESLVSDKPYLVALTQARVAVGLLPRQERQTVTTAQWYRQLIDEVQKLGIAAMAKPDWYDALSIYSNLQELAPDVEDYHENVKIAQRHVRAMRLYGARSGPAATTNPDDEPGWKELVAGVDVEMVRAAISQLDENYVTAPDYRKLAHGALQAIKVLAQTPQAAVAFPTLADAAKRDALVKAIDDLSSSVDSSKRFDQMSLQLTLNDLVKASDDTVAIRKDVLSVEFMDGVLEELDKFSNMIWPYEIADFTKSTMGNFCGVGIQIAKEPGEPLKVVAPLEDSPAYRAGIKSGDIILAVDSQKTEPLSADALVKRITGPENTQVVLTIKRPGMPPRDYTLIRQQIKIKTVKGWQRKGEDWDYMIDPQAKIGYIRLTQFTDQTIRELTARLDDLHKNGVKSLILDLRFNPGGLLRSAGAVSDEFLKDGRIVSTRGRQSGESEINAEGAGGFLDGDMVVLVNQFSASAAEIVAGALKDHHRAIVVGQRSYGKGSVQNVVYVGRRKAILKVTNAYYYLPSGRCLHRKNGDKEWGVDPDTDVLVTPRQMKHWLDIRRKTELLQDTDPEQLKADMAEQYNADVQLGTAVVLLKLKQLQEANPLPADVAEAK